MSVTHDKARVVTTYPINGLIQESYKYYLFLSRIPSTYSLYVLVFGLLLHLITLRHFTVGRTPLDEWSARPTDLNLTTHNNDKRETSMPLVGFKPSIPTSKYRQTHALDCAATRIGRYVSDGMFWYYCGYKRADYRLMNTRVIGNKEPGKMFGPKKN
jgi:hypothetical protein